MKLGFIFFLFFAGQTFADTVNVEDLPDNPIESIQFRCARYDECRELTEQDFLSDYILQVFQNQTYLDINHVEQTALHNGYYIGSQDDLDNTTLDNGFFSGSQIDPSPNGKFYLCEKGKNVVVDVAPIEDLLNPNPIFNIPILNCPSLWVPADHVPPAEPSCLSNCGGGDDGGSGSNGGENGGTSIGGTWNGGYTTGGGGFDDDDDDIIIDDDDDDGGGSDNGGNTNGSDNGSNNGDTPPAPVPAPSSFWNSAAGIAILVLIGVLAS